jgi:hypothetical protein
MISSTPTGKETGPIPKPTGMLWIKDFSAFVEYRTTDAQSVALRHKVELSFSSI